MRKTLRMLALLALAALMAAGAGCSSKHKLVKGAPDWINRGSGAFKDANAKVFYGVGAVTGIASASLSTQTAEQRGRADIGRQLNTYVANLFRDFQIASAGQSETPLEEQHVEDSLKSFTQVTVRGARVIDYWRNPETDTIYALLRLDLEGVKAALEEVDRMDPRLRSYIRNNADKGFDAILREEGRK